MIFARSNSANAPSIVSVSLVSGFCSQSSAPMTIYFAVLAQPANDDWSDPQPRACGFRSIADSVPVIAASF
jgi:hypothetical protein